MFGYRIVAPRMKRMAPQQTGDRQLHPPEGAMAIDGLTAVLAAGRYVAAGSRERRRDRSLVETHQRQEDLFHREILGLWRGQSGARGLILARPGIAAQTRTSNQRFNGFPNLDKRSIRCRGPRDED